VTSIWTGSGVYLRGIEPDDWRSFRQFDEHSADMRNVDLIHPPRSATAYRRWAESQATRETSGDEFQLAIVTLADDAVVGALSTTGTDQRAGRFSYGISIGRDHQRRGYASDAIVVLLTFLFGERRYHKCEVGIHAFNQPSIGLHRKLGFQVEGRLRDHEFFAGRHHDLVVMGLTGDEFGEQHPFPDV
jgi:RimJ/RimL family protein N-acetyltransferase